MKVHIKEGGYFEESFNTILLGHIVINQELIGKCLNPQSPDDLLRDKLPGFSQRKEKLHKVIEEIESIATRSHPKLYKPEGMPSLDMIKL